ncbi:hypothetical protein MIR68_004709 [Amoeboaphelidium protococcarum]|nr:hypothetical protein MIR68_004709 [Amoeboaphelidium protococcarum]
MKSVILNALMAVIATVSAAPSKPQPQPSDDVTVMFYRFANKNCSGIPSGRYQPTIGVVGHCVSYSDGSLKVTQKANSPNEYIAESFSRNGCFLDPVPNSGYPVVPGVYNSKTPGQCVSNGHFSSQMIFVNSAADVPK